MATNTELIYEIAKRVDGQSATIALIQQEMGLVRTSTEQRHDELTDETHQLKSELRLLVERDVVRKDELAELNGRLERQARDHTAELVKLREELTKLRDEHATTRQENAVLKQQLADHVKQVEVWDGRRWGLFVLMFGAIMSLASGLIIALGKK